MNSVIFMRIASVLTLLHCVAHTIGGVFGKPRNGAEEVAVIETMKANSFHFMGAVHTYWDFFFGYGLAASVDLLIPGILFWLLGSCVKSSPGLVRLVALLFCFNYIFTSIIAFQYFFALAGIMEAVMALCLGVAYFSTATTK